MRAARGIWLGLCGVAAVGCTSCRRNAMPPRPDGAAVVVAADAPLGGDVPLVPEAEPNDALATAQRLGLGAAPAVGVAGKLHEGQGKARDTDLFRLDVPPPDPAT